MNGRMDQNGRLTLGHGAPDEDLSRDPLPMRYWDRFRYLLITDGWVAPGKLPQALALGAVVGLYFGPCSVHTTCKRRLKTGCIAQPSCSVSSRPGIRKKTTCFVPRCSTARASLNSSEPTCCAKQRPRAAVLKPVSNYRQYFEDALVPYKHYVPVWDTVGVRVCLVRHALTDPDPFGFERKSEYFIEPRSPRIYHAMVSFPKCMLHLSNRVHFSFLIFHF